MDSSDSSKGIEEVGNTRTPQSKKQISPAKHWCLTWNNYPSDWEEILSANSSKISGYVYGREIGEGGTPHIQGYIRFTKKVRPKKLFPTGIHWEKTNNIDASIKYCRKEEDYIEAGVPPRIKILSEDKFYKWQKDIHDIIKAEPDDRTIMWLYEEEGNVGKSAFTKYLCHKHKALICSGKASDMKYLIVKYREKHGLFPTLIVFDIPRTYNKYLNYTGVEEIKNGCFASTKYECDTIIMNSPHVLIFANVPPDEENMSADRWKIRLIKRIGDDLELVKPEK